MTIKFVTDYPAAFITEKKILVISDLHLGIEHELYEKGIVIHPQSQKFQQILGELIELTKAKTLVILGDLKHEVPGISLREEREIPKLLSYLTERVKVILTKGNHDTDLKGLTPESMQVVDGKGIRIGNYGFFHGHAWPSKKLMQCDYLFMGHLQPSVEFVDDFGYRMVEQVWVKGKLDSETIKKKYKIDKVGKLNIVIAPSFNRLAGSFPVNKILKEQLLGPLLTNKALNLEKSKVYLLDGTYLGLIGKFEK